MLNYTKERAPAEMDMAASPPAPSKKWLKEYGKDAPIALFTCAAVLAHLFLRYVWPVGFYDVLPLYLALLAGGVPLLIGLGRQLLKVEFGSDWLAGFSIVTATLLHEYLVACIVVLMLSVGTALGQDATRMASSALRALARRMPTFAHRHSDTGWPAAALQPPPLAHSPAIFPPPIFPLVE